MDCLFALFLKGSRLQESSLCQSPLELAGEALTVMNRLNCAPLARRCDRRLVIIIMWCWRETEFEYKLLVFIRSRVQKMCLISRLVL